MSDTRLRPSRLLQNASSKASRSVPSARRRSESPSLQHNSDSPHELSELSDPSRPTSPRRSPSVSTSQSPLMTLFNELRWALQDNELYASF